MTTPDGTVDVSGILDEAGWVLSCYYDDKTDTTLHTVIRDLKTWTEEVQRLIDKYGGDVTVGQLTFSDD